MSSRVKSEKRHDFFLAYFILFIIVGFALFQLISTQIEIAQKNKEYEELHAQLSAIEAENEKLQRDATEEHRAEYMEEIARDKLDYAHPQERIYYVVPGN